MYYIIHLSYCITVFVNVLYNTYSGKLFTIQKHCMIIYLETKKHILISSKHLVAQYQSCHTRPIEIQVYLFQIE